MQRPDFNVEEVTKIIRGRRSMFVAQFKENDPIDDSIIDEMLENARWAPTHKLTQPWQFIVYTGDGLKTFGQYQADMYKMRAEKNGTPFLEATYQKFIDSPQKASHVIAILMKRSEGIPLMEEISATAMAVQNMYLTASAHGLAAYWGTGGPTFWPEARKDFGLEGEDILMGFFYVAKPATDNWPEGKRESMDEKVAWIRE
jgi:nitroreductase